jgi:hypothetical protein
MERTRVLSNERESMLYVILIVVAALLLGTLYFVRGRSA